LEECLVLTSQNGVQADNIISPHFEKDEVISSIVMFGATYVKPGEVTFNFEGDWIIGMPFVTNNPIVEEIAENLGVPATTLRRQVGRVTKKLGAALASTEGAHDGP